MTFSFLVVVFNTQAKSAKLTTPTFNSPTQQKFHLKLTSCSAWGALTTYPYNYAETFFSPSAPPWLYTPMLCTISQIGPVPFSLSL